MTIEAATYLSQLSSSLPDATDPKAQGDDHIRLIKAVLQATFPNASRPFRLEEPSSLQTSTISPSVADDGKVIPVSAEAGGVLVNLPAGSLLYDGFRLTIVKADHSNNLVTLDGNSSETVNGALTAVLWQRFQHATVRWSTALSAWLADVAYVPPIGEVTPWTGADACPDGWLFPNGTTIGDASSGASQRANADCRGLFYHLWTQFSNTVCPVSGGRGGSAAADFAAHKTLALPNLAGDAWVGLDTLGGISDAGRLTASINGANTAGGTNGEQVGSESNTLTQAKLPNVSLSGTAASNGDHTHGVTIPSSGSTGAGSQPLSAQNTSAGTITANVTTTGAHTHTTSTSLGGSDEPHANVQPSFVSAWKIKL